LRAEGKEKEAKAVLAALEELFKDDPTAHEKLKEVGVTQLEDFPLAHCSCVA
jgi:hypothetical protein